MPRTPINYGANPNDGTGESLRSFAAAQDSMNEELYDLSFETRLQRLAVGGFEIIAHRGHMNAYPEQTLVAFGGAAGIAHSAEMDVQFSSDGVPFLLHDATVDRTSDLTGAISSLSAAALEAGDFGSWFDPRFTGTKIPRFSDALKFCSQWCQWIYPEIKGYRQQTDIQILLSAIASLGLDDRCIIQSFDDSDLSFARNESDRIVLGYTANNITDFDTMLTFAAEDGNAVMIQEYTSLLANPDRVATARAQGVDIVAWVVPTTTDILQLANIGVRRIMTNKLQHGVLAL